MFKAPSSESSVENSASQLQKKIDAYFKQPENEIVEKFADFKDDCETFLKRAKLHFLSVTKTSSLGQLRFMGQKNSTLVYFKRLETVLADFEEELQKLTSKGLSESKPTI